MSAELLSMTTEVIDSVTPVEKTVKGADHRIDGAVIALFDLEPGRKAAD